LLLCISTKRMALAVPVKWDRHKEKDAERRDKTSMRSGKDTSPRHGG